MQLIAANNAQSTLAGSISNTATSANLASGSGILFAAPSPGQYFVGTFTDAATGLLHEIVWVTNVSGDTITMTRAQEGTTGLNWSANDLFGNLMTAGQLETLIQIAQAQEQGYSYGVDAGIVNAYLIALTPAIGTAPTAGTPILMLASNTNTGASTLNAGWGAANIVRRDGSALIGNEIQGGQLVKLYWKGSVFEYIGLAPATAAAIAAGTDTQSAVTPSQLAGALGSQKLLTGQCQLQCASNVQLALVPYNGNSVPIAGANYQLPSAGLTVGNTGVTLNGTPASNLAANTDYLVAIAYVSSSLQLEFWTLGTGYGPDSTSGNVGVEVITGHPTKTLVGLVGTDASSHFTDQDGSRMTLSWFNRQRKPSKTFFTGNPTVAGIAAMAEVDSSIRNNFMKWGGSSVPFVVNGTMTSVTNTQIYVNGIAFDSTTTPELEGWSFEGVQTVMGFSFSGNNETLAAGRHYATFLSRNASIGNASTFQGGSSSFASSGYVPTCVEVVVDG